MAKSKQSEAILTLEEKLKQALVADVEQPYKVPENWCWTTLKSISNLYNGDRGSNYPSKKDYVTEGVTFINAGAIQNNTLEHIEFNYITQQKYESLRAGKIQKNDILYCLRGSLGKTAIIETDMMGAISSSLCIIRTKKDVLPKYLAYLLRTELITQQQDFAENGSAQPNLSAASVMEYKLPLAPLAEQQRIVDRIERLFSKLDEVKENAQNVIDGFESRKSAILHKAFNGELTAKWREENKVNITEWNLLTLNDVGEYKKGPFGSSITKAMFVPKSQNTYKVYEQGNAIRKTLEYGRYYISKEKYEELKGFSVKGGDIIISCAGTIGEVYKLPDNCEAGIINQALMRVRLFENIEEDFFMYYFGEILKEDINNKSKGTAIKNIPPFKVMKAISIQLPSLPEQREIVHTLNRILFKERQAKEKAEEVLEKIELIKKSILARAFRGELGTNDPDEESSLELLKMVLSEDKDAKINSKSKSK